MRGFLVSVVVAMLIGWLVSASRSDPASPPSPPANATPELITLAINQAYDRVTAKAASALDNLEDGPATEIGDDAQEPLDLLDVQGDDEAPIIRWVNSLMFQAAKDGASDIHIEPGERDVVVRYRVDGMLRETKRAPKS